MLKINRNRTKTNNLLCKPANSFINRAIRLDLSYIEVNRHEKQKTHHHSNFSRNSTAYPIDRDAIHRGSKLDLLRFYSHGHFIANYGNYSGSRA